MYVLFYIVFINNFDKFKIDITFIELFVCYVFNIVYIIFILYYFDNKLKDYNNMN